MNVERETYLFRKEKDVSKCSVKQCKKKTVCSEAETFQINEQLPPLEDNVELINLSALA